MTKKYLFVGLSFAESSAATILARELISSGTSVKFLILKKSTSEFVRENSINRLYTLPLYFIYYLSVIISRLILKDKREIFDVQINSLYQNVLIRWIVYRFKITHLNMHWAGHGFMPLNSLNGINCKIILTLHDFGFVTGGCHVLGDCSEIKNKCNLCPLIKSKSKVAYRQYTKNRKFINNNLHKLTFIAPSVYAKLKLSEILKNSDCRQIDNIINVDSDCTEKVKDVITRTKGNYMLFSSGVKTERDNKGNNTIIKMLEGRESFDYKYLVIVGPRLEYKKSKIETINISSLTHEEMIELIKSSKGILLPSEYETFSMIAMEAMYFGKGVICYDNSGPSNLSKKYTNFVNVCEFRNVEQFLEKGTRFPIQQSSISGKYLEIKSIILSEYKNI